MKMMKHWILMLGLAGLVGNAVAVDPRLSSLSPGGVQIGTETEVIFRGQRLADAEDIFFYHPGVKLVKITEKNDKFVKALIKADGSCPLGEHKARVRTRGGVTELRTFFVGPFALVAKVAPKAGEAPQKLPLNCTVAGSVAAESVDRFAVDVKKGQRISAEVESIRLGRGFYDPYVAIVDSKGFIVARSDDTPLFVQDCFASAVAKGDDVYTIELRETSYGALGGYRLHVGTFPRPTAVYPAGGQEGKELDVKFIDKAAGDFQQKYAAPEPKSFEATFGQQTQPCFRDLAVFPEAEGVVAPSGNKVRVSPFPNELEAEPNNSVGEARLIEAPLPLAFNGIIQTKGDEDWFRFTAKKGQRFDVRVYARKLRSPIDTVMYICNKDGRNLATNDDSGGPDSYISWTVPADGEYTLRIRDHLGNGGPDYTYRVEFQPRVPTLSLYVLDTSRYNTQTRKNVVVARGNRFPLVIQARRGNFSGALALSTKDFPPGITLHAAPMASNKTSQTIVFEAASDAPIGGNLGDLMGKLMGEKVADISGGIWQNYDLVQNGNRGVYYKTWVDKMAAVVVEELPFKIRIEEIKAPLVRAGTLPLKIIAERKEGFKGNINVRMLTRPSGLSCSSNINIPAGKDEITYLFSANSSAEILDHKIAMLGTATVSGATAYVSTQLTSLKIADYFMVGKIIPATTTQGYPTALKCEFTNKTKFPGTASVELVGLPTGTTTTKLEITQDTKELTFPITVADNARAGLHRTVYCKMTLNHTGHTVTQTLGGRGTLRINVPPAPPSIKKPSVGSLGKAVPAK
ncbi:MAG: hypothetical protein HOL43_06030 [Verrucomicrobiales bacterium]|nr:hypothetical protein [Verrucomicrobiales bacterium]